MRWEATGKSSWLELYPTGALLSKCDTGLCLLLPTTSQGYLGSTKKRKNKCRAPPGNSQKPMMATTLGQGAYIWR